MNRTVQMQYIPVPPFPPGKCSRGAVIYESKPPPYVLQRFHSWKIQPSEADWRDVSYFYDRKKARNEVARQQMENPECRYRVIEVKEGEQ